MGSLEVIRFPSLTSLVNVEYFLDFDVKKLKLRMFPALRALTMRGYRGSLFDYAWWHERLPVLETLEHVHQHIADVPYLQYVGVLENEERVKRFKTLKSINVHCTKSESEKLHRLIMDVATSSSIRTLEFDALLLKKKEMDYLSFWFDNEYGLFERNVY